MQRPLIFRCLAEAAGTALLVGIGTGALVAGADLGGVPQWVLAVAWFSAVAVPILAIAHYSGAHINPAVTLALAGSGRFARRDILPYMGSQIFGAFAGSLAVLVSLGSRAHLGATLPRNDNLPLTFALEFVFTFALILSVLYLDRRARPGRTVELLLPPLVVGVSTFVIGPWTGSSLNPARTLAPAVISGEYLGVWVYFLAAVLAALAGSSLLRTLGPRARDKDMASSTRDGRIPP